MVVAAAPVLCLFDRVFIALEGVLVQASGCYCLLCEEFSSDYGGRIRLLFLLFTFSFFLFLKTRCEACGECGAGTTVDCGGSSYVCLFGICTRSSDG